MSRHCGFCSKMIRSSRSPAPSTRDTPRENMPAAISGRCRSASRGNGKKVNGNGRGHLSRTPTVRTGACLIPTNSSPTPPQNSSRGCLKTTLSPSRMAVRIGRCGSKGSTRPKTSWIWLPYTVAETKRKFVSLNKLKTQNFRKLGVSPSGVVRDPRAGASDAGGKP